MFKGKGKSRECKGKGKSKGGKLSPQERAKHRIDPEDQGNLRNHLLPLSRDFPSQFCSRPSTKGYTRLGPTVYDFLQASARTGASIPHLQALEKLLRPRYGLQRQRVAGAREKNGHTPPPQGGPQPQRRTQRPWPRRSQFGIRGHGHDTVNSRTGGSTGMAKNRSLPAAQPPSCDRNINTVLAQKCKSRDAGCYRTMTARQEMSHRLLKASQHSRSRDCDRKSDIPEPT